MIKLHILLQLETLILSDILNTTTSRYIIHKPIYLTFQPLYDIIYKTTKKIPSGEKKISRIEDLRRVIRIYRVEKS